MLGQENVLDKNPTAAPPVLNAPGAKLKHKQRIKLRPTPTISKDFDTPGSETAVTCTNDQLGSVAPIILCDIEDNRLRSCSCKRE